MNLASLNERYVSALRGDFDHPAINYLENRCLPPSIWKAYRLGYDEAALSVTLPHHDAEGNLCGIKRRYIGTDPTRPRYSAVKGSSMGLYGVPGLCGRSILVLAEGEFNALSCAAVRGDISFDVLSIGGEASLPSGLKDLAATYKKIVLSVDEEKCANRICGYLNHSGVEVMLSPKFDGVKMDANQILLSKGRGDLRDFLCCGVYGLNDVPFPAKCIGSLSPGMWRSTDEAAQALLSIYIPGRLFEQMRLKKLLDSKRGQESISKDLVGRLISEILLYEDPSSRVQLRDQICSSFSIDESLVYVPAPICAVSFR